MHLNPLRPAELDTLNYTQVLFHWTPAMGAESYHLQIADYEIYDPFDVDLIHDLDVATNAAVISSGLEWGGTYLWRYWSLDVDGNPGDTSLTHQFSIMTLPDTIWTIEAVITDRERVQPGITIFGMRRRAVLAASDIEGNCIWYLPGTDTDLDQLPNGNMLCENRGTVVETELNGNEIFHSAPTGYHHEVDKLPNGDYIGPSKVYQEIQDPFIPDSSMPWAGDMLIEINTDGDTVWTWSTFDHFSTGDFDSSIFVSQRGMGSYDWSHANTCHMTPDGNAIYMSFRYLNRITMISYPEGEVLWNIGWQYPSGEAPNGENVNFNQQHDPELLPNGNFILYDNHTKGPEDSSRAIEISIDFDRDPVVQNEWEYWVEAISESGGDADRLANGNTLISSTRLNHVIEVTPEGDEVWRLNDTWDITFGMYRSERVPSLYPLAYTIKGPADGDHVPDGESYFPFCINNVGHLDQNFRYNITDTEGWFNVAGGFIAVAAGETEWMIILGEAAEGVANDTITVEVYPEAKPDLIDTWKVIVQSDPAMSIETSPVALPSEIALHSNFPNPFNSQTTISFTLPERGYTTLEVVDNQGRLVKRLLEGELRAGTHGCTWNGTNEAGLTVASGRYYYALAQGDRKLTRRLTFVR